MDIVTGDRMLLHERQPVSRSVSAALALPRDCYLLELLHKQRAADQYYKWTVRVWRLSNQYWSFSWGCAT